MECLSAITGIPKPRMLLKGGSHEVAIEHSVKRSA
jgi:hypothetical protein